MGRTPLEALQDSWIGRLIKRVLWFKSTRRLRKHTNSTTTHIRDTLYALDSQWRNARELGLVAYPPLYNSMYFLLLLHYDFAVLAFNHAAEVDHRKQNLYARQLCLLIHETLDDVPQVFSGDFRNAILALPNGAEHLTSISTVLKTLGSIRKAHHRPIYEIRTFVAAHRDHNALKQIEVMKNIDSLWLMSVSSELVEFLGRMAVALTPVLQEMGSMRVLIQQYLRKTKK